MDYQYIFTGIVHPQRADVNLSEVIKCKFQSTLGISGKIEFSCCKSLITAKIEIDSETINLVKLNELKNTVRQLVSPHIQFLGFKLGCGYEIEIDRVILPNSEVIVFGVNLPALQEKIKTEESRELFIKNIITGPTHHYISIILSDFNRALIDNKNLPFYCYRCLEAIMQFFRNGDKDKKLGWNRMNITLNIDQNDYYHIKELAWPVRHGDSHEWTAEEGVEAVTKTWDIILRFFRYLGKENQHTI